MKAIWLFVSCRKRESCHISLLLLIFAVLTDVVVFKPAINPVDTEH